MNETLAEVTQEINKNSLFFQKTFLYLFQAALFFSLSYTFLSPLWLIARLTITAAVQ